VEKQKLQQKPVDNLASNAGFDEEKSTELTEEIMKYLPKGFFEEVAE
jgi:hypothetical protein